MCNRPSGAGRIAVNASPGWTGSGPLVNTGGPVGMLLPQVVVHVPGDRFARRGREAEQLVFEAVGGFGLVRAVHQPVVQCQLIVEFVAGAHASRLPTNSTNFAGSSFTSIRITTVFQLQCRMK